MQTSFDELYNRLVNAAVHDKLSREVKDVRQSGNFDSHQLDCLLNPEKYPLIWSIGQCGCKDEEAACQRACLFDAISRTEKGDIKIDNDKCTGCRVCVDSCKAKKLVDSKEILPMLETINQNKAPVYALIAPAFIGQFSDKVTPGKLRSAFKMLGFTGMVEVALFADILTLKEALEFDKNINSEEDFLLTSCCCPIWIAMLRKIYHEFMPHVPAAVSPMIACGRSVKYLHPDAVTVFIGPCVAKKAEAKEKDICDAVDYVLTFQEIQDLFDFAEIKPEELSDDDRDHSSKGGRIYARTGGVSQAVKSTVEKLSPDRKIKLEAVQANGIPECKKLLNEIREGNITANFIEGMGCIGGCVGGPKSIIDRTEGTAHVNAYGEKAVYQTPIENPYVIELLDRLGLETVEKLLEQSDIFTREF